MKMAPLLSAIAIAALAAAPMVPVAWPVLAAEKAQAFVDKAIVGGMFEIESSQLALKNSRDPEVKKFADMMVSDHGKANAELEMLAKELGLSAPSKLDDKHVALLKSLQQAGTTIEAHYIKAQLDGHVETVKMFEDYASAGDNEALQNFAVKTLPTLRMHLDMIEQMGDRVGATK